MWKWPFTRKKDNPSIRRRKDVRMLLKSADTSRLEDSWISTPPTADSLTARNFLTLVARSREQSLNNDHARKFLQMVRDNVAGPSGFKLQAHIKNINGKDDKVASQAIEDAWRSWAKMGSCDVTGTLSLKQIERLWVTSVAKDGEAIAVMNTSEEAGDWGFALQLVDPILLDIHHNVELSEGRFIRHGIEFNRFGRPLAYYFNQDDPVSGHIESRREHIRVSADRVIHAFIPEFIGQKRGMPWMSTALWRMRMLKGYENAAVTNARVGASKMGFFVNKDGDSGEDMEPIDMDAEPATFEQIPEGWEFQDWNPQYPSGEFEMFVKASLRSISSGLGVSYNNLASDLTSVNFSSIRQGALDEREVWKGLQEWMIDSFCRRVYEAWLEISLLQGQITINGRPLKPERLEKYKRVSFMGRRWQWIDPLKDANANAVLIKERLRSRSDIIDEQGGDADETWEAIAREEEKLNELGLTIQPMVSKEPEESVDDVSKKSAQDDDEET